MENKSGTPKLFSKSFLQSVLDLFHVRTINILQNFERRFTSLHLIIFNTDCIFEPRDTRDLTFGLITNQIIVRVPTQCPRCPRSRKVNLSQKKLCPGPFGHSPINFSLSCSHVHVQVNFNPDASKSHCPIWAVRKRPTKVKILQNHHLPK